MILSLGAELVTGERRELAVDAQWNPAVAHVRRYGRMPPWEMGMGGSPAFWPAFGVVLHAR